MVHSDTYHPATDTTVEQCCPTFPAQPENVECQESVVNGFTSVTCSFPANGNTPYAYLVPATDAPAQRTRSHRLYNLFPPPSSSFAFAALYLHLQGGAGESTRLHKGGHGAQINGTMKANPGAVYWVYVGAGGGAAEHNGVQSGRGVFWGAGGVSMLHQSFTDVKLIPPFSQGYTSLGEGKPNGQDEAASHCFRHSSHNNQGDCRMCMSSCSLVTVHELTRSLILQTSPLEEEAPAQVRTANPRALPSSG